MGVSIAAFKLEKFDDHTRQAPAREGSESSERFFRLQAGLRWSLDAVEFAGSAYEDANIRNVEFPPVPRVHSSVSTG
ncbi:MAG: hypothetical protein K8R90_04845 [Candidatus Cloacimonetes bacterium]|nr:hypothetical protein [Candidatus Cloacimonadota bacterium]